MWHNLFMLYRKWHNAAPPTETQYAGTSAEGSEKIKKKKKKKNQYFQLCGAGRCCSTSSKVFSFQVLCKLPLQMTKAALLYEMLFFFVISFLKNIYFLLRV